MATDRPSPEENAEFEGIYTHDPAGSARPARDGTDDVRDAQASVEETAFAGWDEVVPLAVAARLVEILGLIPDYDLKGWSDVEYRKVFGAAYDRIWAIPIAEVRALDFNVRTNPELVGRTLAQVSDGVPLFIVSRPSSPHSYGYDKNGTFVKIVAT